MLVIESADECELRGAAGKRPRDAEISMYDSTIQRVHGTQQRSLFQLSVDPVGRKKNAYRIANRLVKS